jgi:hypothetical protein
MAGKAPDSMTVYGIMPRKIVVVYCSQNLIKWN